MPRLNKASPAPRPGIDSRGIAELVKSMRASMPKEPISAPTRPYSGGRGEPKPMPFKPIQAKPITLRDVAREVPGATRKVLGGIANQFIATKALRAIPRAKKGR